MGELLGIVVAERYELTGILGHGGQGVVYRALDRTTGRGVAVKMLSDSVADDPAYAARLAREQEALVALAGTSAVAVYDLCEAPNGSLCLVMELLEGTDLETHLGALEGRGQRMPLPRLSGIIEPIVDTLERAHDVGIVHRDLKPANIFLLSDGEGVRLFDFGLSRSRKAVRLTLAGTVMGSPSYIAPEVWKGDSDSLDGRVDVYSLAVILFRLLSGRLPFEGKTLKESLDLASSAPRPSLRALRPDLSTKIDAWVEQGLAIDRERRYQTARGLFTGLLKALGYQPPARPMRPVADSLVGAWRAATGAFRRLVETATAAIPVSRPPTSAPESLSPPAAEVKAVDEGWMELTDADELRPLHANPRTAPPPRKQKQTQKPVDIWSEVTQDELSPSVPPPAADEGAPAEATTTTSDDGWQDVTDDEVDRPSFYSTTAEVKTYLDSVAPEDAPPAPVDGKGGAAGPASRARGAATTSGAKAPAGKGARLAKQKKKRGEKRAKSRGKGGTKGDASESKKQPAASAEKKPPGGPASRRK